MKIVLKLKTIFLATLILTLASVTSGVSAQTTNIYMGLRLPQMNTQQRANIGAEANPAQARGQMIFNTDSGALQYWTGTEWTVLLDHESILNHIVNNITQEFIDSILIGLTIESPDQTIRVVRVGPTHIELSVDITTIADSLVNNAWFVENLITTLFENNTFIDSLINNLVNNQTFIDSMVNNFLTHNYFMDSIVNNLVNNQTFIDSMVNNFLTHSYFMDSIVNNLVNNQTFIDSMVNNFLTHSYFMDSIVNNLVNNQTFIDSMVNNFLTHSYFMDSIVNNLVNNQTFIDSMVNNFLTHNYFMDSIVNNLVNNQTFIDSMVNNFLTHSYFMDSIVNNLLNNNTFLDSIINNIAMNITSELVDSIMANVSIIGNRGVIVTGSGTRNIAITLPEGQREGEVLTWDNTLEVWRPAETAVIRQLVIPVQNGNFTTENLIFYGVTSTSTNPLQVVNIEPVFSNNQARRTFLRVDASVTVQSNAAEWSVSIENRNFVPTNHFSLTSVIISYISSDVPALTSDSQGFIQILGF